MYEAIDWIHRAQNVERFQAVVETKVNVLGSIKGRAFFEKTSGHQFLKMNSTHGSLPSAVIHIISNTHFMACGYRWIAMRRSSKWSWLKSCMLNVITVQGRKIITVS